MRLDRIFTGKAKIAAVAITLTIVCACTGTTIAYLKDSTQTIDNNFSLGSIETKILEVVSGTGKEPYVLNVGENDCYIRMKAIVSPAESNAALEDYVTGLDSVNWVYNSQDGFYYYQNIVSPNNYTETPLFTGIDESKVTPDSKVEIVLYQEAVQTEVSANDVVITDMTEIWKFYDKYGKTSQGEE